MLNEIYHGDFYARRNKMGYWHVQYKLEVGYISLGLYSPHENSFDLVNCRFAFAGRIPNEIFKLIEKIDKEITAG